MATVSQEITTTARPDQVWDAVKDFGNPHTRLVPGFVIGTRMDGDARVVTFANGDTAKEPLIAIDDKGRRLVWSAESEAFQHYNASLQVLDANGHTRVIWTSDFLPHQSEQWVANMIGMGLAAMKANLDKLNG